MSEELVRLSASRIKTLQTCTWTYYANYVLKLPQTNNSGAMRGTIAHLIFEVLSNPRHAKYVEEIISNNTCRPSKAVWRLILKTANKLGLDLTESVKPIKKEGERTNLECIDDMILVGLRYDFINDQELIGSEWSFDITNEEPKYRIVGFVDRLVKDNGKLVIRDYKSSKKTFDTEELESNLQSMMYSLAARRHFPDYDNVNVKFLFLRYPDAPEKESPEFTPTELTGFEHYLEYVSNYLTNFDEKKGMTTFAKHDYSKKWMCKTKSGWKCPYLDPIDYKCLIDKDGKMIKSIFITEDFKASEIKDGYTIEVRKYDGCPAWKKQEIVKDSFDF
jgi:hypothetical protein